jgi:hypothetical protein
MDKTGLIEMMIVLHPRSLIEQEFLERSAVIRRSIIGVEIGNMKNFFRR